MAQIHRTTMTPGKLDLLTAWLPYQPWYATADRAPELSRVGGFRLDDPAGEVGIEFLFVADAAGPVVYHLPLTYRGGPAEGLEHALIGTSEHGVLGMRWVYDGARDPVLLGQLLALLRGEVEAQAQSVSDTPDPSVVVDFADPHQASDLQLVRVLVPAGAPIGGCVLAGWQLPDGTSARGPIALARPA